jgi:hypothetical protein
VFVKTKQHRQVDLPQFTQLPTKGLSGNWVNRGKPALTKNSMRNVLDAP